MFSDPFYTIHESEIFLESLCLDQEHYVTNTIASYLVEAGYQSDQSGRRWSKDDKQIILCFVDDFGVTVTDSNKPPPTWFNETTMVITDNYTNFHPEFEVFKITDSYFGIYSYFPGQMEWTPQTDFHLSVNRIDNNRILMLLELIKAYGVGNLLTNHVNFNCVTQELLNGNTTDVKQSFLNIANTHSPFLPATIYSDEFLNSVSELMPIRTHKLSIERASMTSWVTVVMETYISEHVISLSEKIFRALVTPVPWVGICSRGSIQFLEDLGFDTMSDLIDHGYNKRKIDCQPEQSPAKFAQYVTDIQRTIDTVKTKPFTQVKQRALQAAIHNQQHLKRMNAQFKTDFAVWFDELTKIC